MIVKGLKITDTEVRYVFPRNLQPIKSFSNIHEFGMAFRKHFSREILLPNFPYQHLSADKGLVKCRFCNNQLRYELSTERRVYELKEFCIEHFHRLNKDKHEEENKDVYIKSYKDIKHAKRDIEELVEKYHQRFEEKEARKKRQVERYDTFDAMIKAYKQKGCYVHYQPEIHETPLGQNYPDLLLIITPKMKQKYLQFGRCIGFDFTFNMVFDRPAYTQGRKWQYLLGLIAGFNGFRKITIYGLVISTKQDPKTVETIFKKFFEHMGKKPESIVTDEAVGMISGVNNLKKQGIYEGGAYWDTFHVLKTHGFRDPEIRRGLRHMVRQKCKYKFQQMYLQAVNLTTCEQDMDGLHRFMYQSQKCCISQIQPIFVGLGVSDTQNEIAHNIIKSQITHEDKYLNVVTRLIHYLQERNTLTSVTVRESCKIEEVVGLRENQILRISLPMRIHALLYTQVFKANLLELIYIEPDKTFFIVQDTSTVYKVDWQKDPPKDFTPTKTSEQQCKIYECGCDFKLKTGVPCEHIVKVVINQGGSLLDQVSRYYVIENPENLEPIILMHNKGEQKIRKRGRQSFKAVFYLQRNEDDQLPDKVATVKVRQKKQWAGWSTRDKQIANEAKQSSFMLLKENQKKDLPPEYIKKQKFINNRSQMMKKFYSQTRRRM